MWLLHWKSGLIRESSTELLLNIPVFSCSYSPGRTPWTPWAAGLCGGDCWREWRPASPGCPDWGSGERSQIGRRPAASSFQQTPRWQEAEVSCGPAIHKLEMTMTKTARDGTRLWTLCNSEIWRFSRIRLSFSFDKNRNQNITLIFSHELFLPLISVVKSSFFSCSAKLKRVFFYFSHFLWPL